MNIRRKYRCFVCCLLVSGICLLGFSVWHLLCSRIPDTMTVSGYGEIPELFSEPVAQWISGEVTVKNGKTGTAAVEAAAGETAGDGYVDRKSAGGDFYDIEYTLFGKIPLKTVQACVAAPKLVYAGGTPIGMYLRTSEPMRSMRKAESCAVRLNQCCRREITSRWLTERRSRRRRS